MSKVKKPTQKWLAVLVVSIIVFIGALAFLGNQIQHSPNVYDVTDLNKLPNSLNNTTIAISYVSYIAFIASGVMISFNLKSQKKKKR